MSPLTEVAAAADAIKQRLGSARSDIDKRVRQAERVFTHAQHTAEDGVDAAVTQIRRHPLRAVAIATGVGAFVGAAFGLAWNRWLARTKG
jgi:ElaB/YqjD/DUF883 family membrane-anchored ribosome-binding protein